MIEIIRITIEVLALFWMIGESIKNGALKTATIPAKLFKKNLI